MSPGTPTFPVKKTNQKNPTTELNLKRKSQKRIVGLFQNAKIICQKKGKKGKTEMIGMLFHLKL